MLTNIHNHNLFLARTQCMAWHSTSCTDKGIKLPFEAKTLWDTSAGHSLCLLWGKLHTVTFALYCSRQCSTSVLHKQMAIFTNLAHKYTSSLALYPDPPLYSSHYTEEGPYSFLASKLPPTIIASPLNVSLQLTSL